MGSFGYVYLLRLEQDPNTAKCVYKIGRTNDLRNRQKMLGVLMPFDVTLVWAIPCTDAGALEAFFHRELSEFRMNGEWFRLSLDEVGLFVMTGFTLIRADAPSNPDTEKVVTLFATGEMNYDLFHLMLEANR